MFAFRFTAALATAAFLAACGSSSHSRLEGMWVMADAECLKAVASTNFAYKFNSDGTLTAYGPIVQTLDYGAVASENHRLKACRDPETDVRRTYNVVVDDAKFQGVADLGTPFIYYYKLDGDKLTLSESPEFSRSVTLLRRPTGG